jgi:hypothetical protein
LLAASLAACAGQGDIDRTQPDKVDKSIFVAADGTPRTFYYRKTTVGVPPTSAYAFEGTMGELMKVRFDIREKFLVGYRAYDYAPGSQSAFSTGANNSDTPLIMFAITSQFDVKRDYNPGTGEQTNVILENTTDRPWNERQYMRVDWSKNLVDTPPSDQMNVDPTNPFFPAETLSTGFAVGEGDQALINPDRPIITHEYVDFATKELRTPDYNACMTMFDTFDDSGPWGCGPAEITYRNALLPVPASNYEPLAYPDRQLLTGDDGKPIRYAFDVNGNPIDCSAAALAANGLTGDDCADATMDQFAKFGYFRTVRPTYDRQVGATEQGRDYLINRWNIWTGDTIQRDRSGQPLLNKNGDPMRTRYSDRIANGQVRQITYYTNPEFPDDAALFASAQSVIGDWNQTIKETVAAMAYLQNNSGTDRSFAAIQKDAQALPDIFVLKKNDCSMTNVQQFLSANPDIKALAKSKIASSTLDFDNFAAADLLKVCSGLSAVTEDLKDGDAKKFVWQRNGDLRYSFLFWVDRPQPSGPLGYGPSSQDPETGEIISAAAYIYGASLDTYAQFAVDSVRLANGQLDPDDLLAGKTISDVLAETKSASLARAAEPITPAARAAAYSKLQSLGRTQSDRLVKVAAGIDDQPVARIKGSTIEKLLVNDDILPGLVPGYRPGDTPPADAFDQGMNMPWFSRQAAEQRKSRFQNLASNGTCLYMADFADDAILGTALDLNQRGLTPEDMFTELRARIFRGLADHEVGHTMGLRHNFSSSTDALNYDDQYWQIRTTQPQSDWESKYSLSEFGYASVMDYGSRFNSDIRGLGKYDTAAIRFGYGQLIDIIKNADEASNQLANDIFYDDYTKIPSLVGSLDNMSTGSTTVASYTDDIALWTNGLKDLPTNQGFFSVYPERPYKFCSDEFEGNFDCKTWDKGANQREIVGNTTDMFRNYYVFNAYKRGRTTWQIDSYLNRLESRYFNRYSEAFQFFYFFGPSLAGTDFGDDLLGASIDSLNALGAVLQEPEPGLHCTTAYSPNVLMLPNSASDCNATQAMLNLPDAKPFFINFSNDYYYRITRTGSLYEKLEALFTLTSTESRFFRVDTFADSNRYSINYYRVFRDQMVNLLSGVIRNDPKTYGATLPNGVFQPTPVVDPTTYGVADAPTPPYAMPNAVHVDTPVNKTIRYWALLLALSRLGSTWDYTLDFQNFLAIAEKGADDDFTLASTITVKEFTHPTTGVIYRAPAYTNPNNIGADIIDELNTLVGTAGTPGTIPLSYGTLSNGAPLPNWYTAKAALDAASTATDQTAYQNALSLFTFLDQTVAYRVDLIGDIRLFRKQINLLNGVNAN